MATDTEKVPDRALNVTREPKGTNRMAGDGSANIGVQASTDALILVCIAWAIVFGLAFSLRDYIK